MVKSIKPFSRRPYWQQTADLFNTIYKSYVKLNVAGCLRREPTDTASPPGLVLFLFYPSPEGNRTLIGVTGNTCVEPKWPPGNRFIKLMLAARRPLPVVISRTFSVHLFYKHINSTVVYILIKLKSLSAASSSFTEHVPNVLLHDFKFPSLSLGSPLW